MCQCVYYFNSIQASRLANALRSGRTISTTSALKWNLNLTDEQREFQDVARKFAKEEILPVVQHHDKTGEYPWDLVKKAHSLGLMNGHIPPEYGKMICKYNIDGPKMISIILCG